MWVSNLLRRNWKVVRTFTFAIQCYGIMNCIIQKIDTPGETWLKKPGLSDMLSYNTLVILLVCVSGYAIDNVTAIETTSENGADNVTKPSSFEGRYQVTPSPSNAVRNTATKIPLYLGGYYSINGRWDGSGVVTAVEMALDHVNKKTDLLNGYELKIIWNNTKVGNRQCVILINTSKKKNKKKSPHLYVIWGARIFNLEIVWWHYKHRPLRNLLIFMFPLYCPRLTPMKNDAVRKVANYKHHTRWNYKSSSQRLPVINPSIAAHDDHVRFKLYWSHCTVPGQSARVIQLRCAWQFCSIIIIPAW